MPSLTLLEFLALGGDLPVDWRSVITARPDEQPLLFRWVEFVRVPPPELAGSFLVPLEWRACERSLVVVPWPGSLKGHGVTYNWKIPASILPYFRLYRTLPEQRCPEPLQMDHPHVHLDLRKAG